MAVEEITDEQFENEVEKAKGIVVADFFAVWCGPCQAMAPIIDKVAEDLKEAKFVKIDVDKNPKSSNKYGVMSIPTIFIFKDGQVKDQITGIADENSLKEKVKKARE